MRLKLLAGNPGKRPVDAAMVQPPGGFPNCPHELTGHARAEWSRLRGALRDIDLVTPADRAAVMGYCLAFQHMVDAEAKVAEMGMIVTTNAVTKYDAAGNVTERLGGNIIQNPYLSVANKSRDQMRQFLSELGLSPTSRAGLKLAGRKPPRDSFDTFMGEGRKEHRA